MTLYMLECLVILAQATFAWSPWKVQIKNVSAGRVQFVYMLYKAFHALHDVKRDNWSTRCCHGCPWCPNSVRGQFLLQLSGMVSRQLGVLSQTQFPMDTTRAVQGHLGKTGAIFEQSISEVQTREIFQASSVQQSATLEIHLSSSGAKSMSSSVISPTNGGASGAEVRGSLPEDPRRTNSTRSLFLRTCATFAHAGSHTFALR